MSLFGPDYTPADHSRPASFSAQQIDDLASAGDAGYWDYLVALTRMTAASRIGLDPTGGDVAAYAGDRGITFYRSLTREQAGAFTDEYAFIVKSNANLYAPDTVSVATARTNSPNYGKEWADESWWKNIDPGLVAGFWGGFNYLYILGIVVAGVLVWNLSSPRK